MTRDRAHLADQFLLEFHRTQPGCTSQAFARGRCKSHGLSSYELLTELALSDDRIVDIGCGDGHLLELLRGQWGSSVSLVGIDMSAAELQRARRRAPSLARYLLARASALPIASSSVSLLVSHLAFHLMTRVDEVVWEIARVLAPDGRFACIVGGGPKLGDSFEAFLDLALSRVAPTELPPRLGDMRARTEAGLVELFSPERGFGAPAIDDHDVDLSAPFEVVWQCLSTMYELAAFDRGRLDMLKRDFRVVCAEFRKDDGTIRCSMMVRRVQVARC